MGRMLVASRLPGRESELPPAPRGAGAACAAGVAREEVREPRAAAGEWVDVERHAGVRVGETPTGAIRSTARAFTYVGEPPLLLPLPLHEGPFARPQPQTFERSQGHPRRRRHPNRPTRPRTSSAARRSLGRPPARTVHPRSGFLASQQACLPSRSHRAFGTPRRALPPPLPSSPRTASLPLEAPSLPFPARACGGGRARRAAQGPGPLPRASPAPALVRRAREEP